MAIIKAKIYKKHEGFSNESLSVKILVDKMPEFRFREINTIQGEIFFYAESEDGLVECYKYVRNSTEGYGGRKIVLTMENGAERVFNGQLWNSWERHHRDEIPKHFEIAVTDNEKTWNNNGVFCAMAVKDTLFYQYITQ